MISSTVFLRFVLWFEPDHPINFVRLFFFSLWGAVGLRETFQVGVVHDAKWPDIA